MIFKDTRTHTCKSSGHFRAQGGEAGSWTCFRKLCTSSPSIAYNMRHYVMNTRMHACTHRCAHRLPTFDRTVHFSILHYEVVERTRARLNANISSPPNLTKIPLARNSANRLKTLKSRFERPGSNSRRVRIRRVSAWKKRGMKEGRRSKT